MFDKGDRVVTPGGPGVVVYRRMASPDYATVAVYSVRLDSMSNASAGYTGTIYPAAQVTEEVKT